MRKLVIATNLDDWEALFIDGVQVTAGHKIHREELLPYVVAEPCQIEEWSIEPEYSYDLGGLPNTLDEIPKDKIEHVKQLV